MKMQRLQREDSKRSDGFTLVEVIIAIVILMVGLLGILALFGTALSATAHAQDDLVAKQKARELLEAVYSARDDANVTWDQLQNDTAGGIFKSGWKPLLRVTPNSQQILGTIDPPNGPGEGPTADYVLALDGNGNLNVPVPLSNYLRRVDIIPVNYPDGSVNPNLRSITVTVRVLGKINRDYTVAGYISSYR